MEQVKIFTCSSHLPFQPDRSITLERYNPPTAYFLKMAAGIKKGSRNGILPESSGDLIVYVQVTYSQEMHIFHKETVSLNHL